VIALDPYQIFAQARAYWDAQRYPRYLDYDTVVDVHDSRGERTERYTSAYDASTNTVWVEPVSDYERAHPATGRGIGFNLGSGNQPAPDQDFIGVPILAPNYSFTIGHFTGAANTLSDAQVVQQVRDAFHDPTPPRKPATPGNAIPEIAVVEAFRHDYRIALAAEETIDGVLTYHLSLDPVHRDGRYRLRDVWIDERTFATVRARTALNFVDGPGTMIPWTIDFADVNGAHYIADESAGGKYNYVKRGYDRVDIRFENIRPRESALPFAPVRFSAFLILVEPTPQP